MDFSALYKEIITTASDMALASAVDNVPNVRIVNFICDETKNGVLYIATFSDNPKIAEFNQNDKVAFTTISVGNEQHVRVKGATVKKSSFSIDDIKSQFFLFLSKIYEKQGNLSKAIFFAHESLKSKPFLKNKIEVFNYLSDLHRINKNFTLSLSYKDSAMIDRKSVV